MQYYLLSFAATILLALDFSLNKLYQRRAGSSAAAAFAFNALCGLFVAILAFAFNGFKFDCTPFSLILAIASAATVMLYSIAGMKLLNIGELATYTLFLMTGGMTLPYIFGLIFWNEPFSIFRTLGLLLIITGVVCANLQQKHSHSKHSWLPILLGIFVFIINGFSSVVTQIHQNEITYETVDSVAFLTLIGLSRAISSGIAFIFSYKNDRENIRSLPINHILLITAASAVVSGASYLFQLISAANLPATVLYPIVTGGSIVFTAFAGWLLFHEKPSARTWSGVILSLIGTLLFL